MEKPIDKVYDEIRQSLGFGIDENQGWLLQLPGVSEPLVIKGKQVVTPTREVLKEADWDKYQPFHPLCENIRRRKSIVLTKLQAYITVRLKTVLSETIAKMVELYLNTDHHDKLTIDQREILKLFATGAGGKTAKNINLLLAKLLQAAPGEAELIAVGVRRSGTWKGEEYDRMTTISFPVMDEEHLDGGKVYGTNVTVRDKEIFYKLLRFILPGIDNIEAYNYGSRSEVAPQFHSLMLAYNSVATDLNKATKLLQGYDKDFFKRNFIVTTWAAQCIDLHPYRDAIPTLDGNDGEPNKDEMEKAEKAQADRNSRRQEPRRNSETSKYNPFRDERKERKREEERRERDERDERDRRRDERRSFRDDDYDDYDDRDRYRRRDDRYRRDRDDYDDRRDRRRSFRDEDRRYDDDRDENGVTIRRRSRSRYDDDRGGRRRNFR